MKSLSVVLDSCVIYPMPLCDTLLRAVEAEIYQIYFSQEILEGATRNLVKNGRMTDVKAVRFQEELKKNFPEAMVEVPPHLVAAMTNDPGDRHVVAAAIVANAEVIVTSNLKDFPVEALAPWGIEAWHPDDFLVYLDENFPEKMFQVIQQQSEDLENPPVSVAQLLNKLEKNNRVPNFARTIRCYEYGNSILQIAKKALDLLGKPAKEGGSCFDGKRYRLWCNQKSLTITSKDSRGEILRFENGGIGGKLSSEDIETFQIFAKSLEQEISQPGMQKSESL
ncbi:PIN domain-containing protein [Nostoc sp. CHAB 5844]|nr:PIN domain-containing protein [Nostoc sp. CHAB 5844]